MQWLTALLAFATTMLIFAVIVSTFVELIHRVFRLRGKGMQLMLENLYTRVIKAHLTTQQRDRMNATEFAAIIMENRAIARTGDEQKRGLFGRLLDELLDSSSMTEIPVEVFTQKLANSRIVGKAEHFTDEVLQDIAQKYEAFGHEIGTYFGRRARVFSVCIAFVVVWLFYVNPYDLAVTYFKNPAIAQSVADLAADAQKDYRALVDELQAVTEDGSVSEQDAGALRAAIDELRQELDEARISTSRLAELGVPVGWPGADELIASCSQEADSVLTRAGESAPLNGFCRLSIPVVGVLTIPTWKNVFWLLVGGLLVGLGAPFWAQAVSGLTATRDLSGRVTRAVGGAADDTAGRPRARGMAPMTEDTPAHVRTFNVSLSQNESKENSR